MKSIFLVLMVCLSIHFDCIAQKQILYEFEDCVIDSLQQGINKYNKLFQEKSSQMKFYAIVVEENNEYEIYLEYYSSSAKGGLIDLIKRSKRKIKMPTATIPIVFMSDILSQQVKKDKIAMLPLYGYYVNVVYDDHRQKVVQTAWLY